MKNSKSEEAGFGLVGIVIAVVAIVLLGIIGARAFMMATSEKETQSTNQNTQSPRNAPVAIVNYLDIKELGVKLKLDEQVKDTTYAVQTLDDGSLVARFSTQSLAAVDPACDAHSGQLGALDMSTTNTDRLGDKLIPDGQTVFKFGKSYYTYASSQALCSESVRSMVDTKIAAFRESLKTLQPDK